MVTKKITIKNAQGFHMRPASTFANSMTKYKSDIFLIRDNNRINGKSLMNIIAGCIKCGMEIEVECTGEDEQQMLDEAISIIESGFGE